MTNTPNKDILIEKISGLLIKNNVLEDNYATWLKACDYLGEEELQQLVDILSEINDPETFAFLNQNVIAKYSAFSKNDQVSINKILAEEEKFLEKLDEKEPA